MKKKQPIPTVPEYPAPTVAKLMDPVFVMNTTGSITAFPNPAAIETWAVGNRKSSS